MLVSVLNDKSAISTVALLCRWVINNGNCNLCSSITTKVSKVLPPFRVGLLEREMSVSSQTTLPVLMGHSQHVEVVTLRNRKSHTHTHTYIYVCVCICIYIYICVCVCVCVYIYIHTHINVHVYIYLKGALRYKPEDRGFDSPWCHWNFSLT